ncbi:MAG: CapA family protein [Actinobacteria bacterium]|nr:CapA family protein [Actinomycetota bacterium]
MDAPVDAPLEAPVTIAFAGDVHAEGGAGQALRAGLPSIREALARPDLTVVNVEMAITEGGSPASKQYAFRAPATALRALRDAGVDVVTMANNHGLDYGVAGLRDSLAAAESTGLLVVGIGVDEDQAYAPALVTVRGQRIAVLGATQVLDGNLDDAWTAGAGKPGLASAKREARLLREVTRARDMADTVVVYLHWGAELEPCPLPRQQQLARALVAAGADIIVGAHAHVPLGGGYLDGAYVDYGLGNFVFNTKGGEGALTGVLTLTVQGRAVTGARYAPAVIRDGAPHPLTGEPAERARTDKQQRRGCTGLAASR